MTRQTKSAMKFTDRIAEELSKHNESGFFVDNS
jgi:hypothetical protein